MCHKIIPIKRKSTILLKVMGHLQNFAYIYVYISYEIYIYILYIIYIIWKYIQLLQISENTNKNKATKRPLKWLN